MLQICIYAKLKERKIIIYSQKLIFVIRQYWAL